MKKYEVISFDAYNTIFNVESSIKLVIGQLNSNANKEWENKFWKRLSLGIKNYFMYEATKKSFEKTYFLYKYALKTSGLINELTCSIDEAIELIKNAHSNSTLIPGISNFINDLKKEYRLVVVLSDSDTDVLKSSLVKNNLSFDIILTSEIAKGYKPNNENVFFLLSEIINYLPSKVLHIGDSTFDVLGSSKVGFQSCLFNPLSHLSEEIKESNHFIADTISDLYKLTLED